MKALIIAFLAGAAITLWFPIFIKAMLVLVIYFIVAALAIFLVVSILGQKS